MRKKSIVKQINFSNMIILLMVLSAVVALVIFLVSNLSNRYAKVLQEQSEKSLAYTEDYSSESKDRVYKFYSEAIQKKGETLLAKDANTVRTAFLDNAFSQVRDLLKSNVKIDEDLIHAEFFTYDGEEIKAWQVVNKYNPDGILTKTIYDSENSKWVSGEFDAEELTIPTSDIKAILESASLTVKRSTFRLRNITGQFDEHQVFDCYIPIIDGQPDEVAELLEAGEAVGFLRYVVTLEKIQSHIKQEESALESNFARVKASQDALIAETKEMGDRLLLYSLGVLAGFLLLSVSSSLFASIRLSKSIVKPIFDLKSFSKNIANGDYSQEIKIDSNNEIGDLAQTFEEMRVKVKSFTDDLQRMVDERTEELERTLVVVTEQNQKLQLILNNINQGIIVIKRDFRLDDQYSKSILNMFEVTDQQIKNTDHPLKLLLRNSNIAKDEVVSLTTTLEVALDHDAWMWELNKEKLLYETTIKSTKGERIIVFDWIPIVNDADQITNIVVVINDLTDQKALEKKNEEQRKQTEVVLSIAEVLTKTPKSALISFLSESENRILDVYSIMNTDRSINDEVLRELHTIKGGARVAKIPDLVQLVHEAEEVAKNREYEALSEFVGEIDNFIKIWLQKIKEVFGDDEGSINANLFALMSVLGETIFGHIQESGLNRLSLKIESNLSKIHKELVNPIKDMLSHALYNAADHGYCFPKQNGELESDSAELEVSLCQNGSNLILTVADHGKGFDDNKIKENIKGTHMDGMKPLEAVLADGVTTAASVTKTSGRGVGLSSIKSIAVSNGGSIKLSKNDPKGAKICIELPITSSLLNKAG